MRESPGIARGWNRAGSRLGWWRLIEISSVNNGELDISSRFAVQTRWQGDMGQRGDWTMRV